MKKVIKHIFNGVLLGAASFALYNCTDDFKEPAKQEGSSILAIASASQDFNIIVAAWTKAGLASNLDNLNSGSVTVFAPNDDAFLTYFKTPPANIALPPGAPTSDSMDEANLIAFINTLKSSYPIPPNPSLATGVSYFTLATLTNILTNEIVSSKITSDHLTDTPVLTTQNSARLSVSKVGSDFFLNANGSNGAKLVSVDNIALNGVIHTIDKVVLPVSVASDLAFLSISVNYNTNPPTVTTSTSGANANYDLLRAAVVKTGLATTLLPNTSPLPDFTFFAPNDAAIQAYWGAVSEDAAKTTINGLTGTALSDFANLLKYHVVAGRILSSDLTNGQQLTSVAGGTFTVNISDPDIMLVDKSDVTTDAKITSPNNLTNAGVVHGINAVMLPN
jgi:uncharacterized surface protein with fasciclin (FAS1) repeats